MRRWWETTGNCLEWLYYPSLWLWKRDRSRPDSSTAWDECHIRNKTTTYRPYHHDAHAMHTPNICSDTPRLDSDLSEYVTWLTLIYASKSNLKYILAETHSVWLSRPFPFNHDYTDCTGFQGRAIQNASIFSHSAPTRAAAWSLLQTRSSRFVALSISKWCLSSCWHDIFRHLSL